MSLRAGPAAGREVRRRTALRWAVLLAAAAVIALSGLAIVRSTPLHFHNGEDLYNATVAREIAAGDGHHLLHLQYQSFSGGCTVISLLGSVAFRLFGVSYLAWKSVPALLSGVLVLLGFAFLARAVGRAAGWAFVVLFVGAPALLVQATLMAWGNHYEVMLLVLLQGLLAVTLVTRQGRGASGGAAALWFGWGLTAGLGFWFCFSSVFALPALALVVGLALPRRRWWPGAALALAGLACGLAPLGVYRIVAGVNPLALLLEGGGAGWGADAGAKLWEASLGHYAASLHFLPGRSMSGALGPLSLAGLWGAALTGAILAVRGPRSQRRWIRAAPAAMLALCLATYALSSFRVEEPIAGTVPAPFDIRYLVPAMVTLLVAAAAGLGLLWRRGGWARGVACLLLFCAALPGLWTRTVWALGPAADSPSAEEIPPFFYAHLLTTRAPTVPEQAWLDEDPADWISRVNHRRSLGQRRAGRLLALSPAEAPGMLTELRSLPGIREDEVPLVLHGLGSGLAHLHRTGQIEPGEYLPQVVALLEACAPGEGRALAVGLWTEHPVLALGEAPRSRLPAPAEIEALVAGPLGGADCALCPALGEALGLTPPPRDVGAVGDLLRGGEASLPATPVARGAVLEGVGARYGREFGYRTAATESFASGWPAGDRSPFLRGFEIGRAQRWVVDVPRGTPAERVP